MSLSKRYFSDDLQKWADERMDALNEIAREDVEAVELESFWGQSDDGDEGDDQ